MKQSASLIWSKYNPMQINSPIQLALQILRPYGLIQLPIDNHYLSGAIFVRDGAVVDVNTDKYFIKGGISNDTGLTGRKIIVDTYGGLAPHGGGAFSGKDPTKVDRSAAYMCRYVAKSLVANDFATECQVAVSYNFGEDRPAMIVVTADGEYSEKITKFVKSKFDFSPNSIIERLNLRFTKYYPTSKYGHFTDPKYEWEKICEL